MSQLRMKNNDAITILMPVKDQKKEFLQAALLSVINQSSPDWQLLAIVAHDTPQNTREVITSFKDERIQLIVEETNNFAAALNTGMRRAGTEFVCILLSDDQLATDTVKIVQRYRKEYPTIDFFHGSRRKIDSKGNFRSSVISDSDNFQISHFKKRGSPVKHLLCWRRKKALEIGGMDESLSDHGCDDYDFPWAMAEAGCKFKVIKECTYYYRMHHDAPRLTTYIPLQKQVAILKAMFRKHGVSEEETDDYIEKSLNDYLPRSQLMSYDHDMSYLIGISNYKEIAQDRSEEFLKKGYLKKYFFPHRIYYLPKGGPDAFRHASRLCRVTDPAKLWEIVLYGVSPTIDEFPEDLFFDKELIWHEQQFGRTGQAATANLAVDGNRMFGYGYVSDLVQRISSHRREHKTRIEKLFKGWNRMLLNAAMNFALERGIETFYSVSADLMMKNTDTNRRIKRELFDRIYDRNVRECFSAKRHGDWWRIDVHKNQDRIVIAKKRQEIIERGKTICITHDIERGLGHVIEDPPFSTKIHEPAEAYLEEMLQIEKTVGIRGTYNVVGSFMDEVRERIEREGHAVGFHSYDHRIKSDKELIPQRKHFKKALSKGKRIWPENQLAFCRKVDYRIKGYRPPQSKITAELDDIYLTFFNYEWLASSSSSLGRRKRPFLENGIVKIPIHFEDFGLYQRNFIFEEWEQKAIDLVRQNDFVAINLHDCYAGFWLSYYRRFLEKIRPLGHFKTFDEVAAETTLCSAGWVLKKPPKKSLNRFFQFFSRKKETTFDASE